MGQDQKVKGYKIRAVSNWALLPRLESKKKQDITLLPIKLKLGEVVDKSRGSCFVTHRLVCVSIVYYPRRRGSTAARCSLSRCAWLCMRVSEHDKKKTPLYSVKFGLLILGLRGQ